MFRPRSAAPLFASLLTSALWWGCGDRVGPITDASLDGSGDAGITLSLAPCPDGWREAVDPPTGVVFCDPWPETGAMVCPRGELFLPGTAGCAPLGDPCPAGDFADSAGATAIHVLPGATDGDGSETAPFGTVAEAIAVATPGAVILLGKGEHDLVGVPGLIDTWLRGACASETRLVTGELRAVSLQGDIRFDNLQIDGFTSSAADLRSLAFDGTDLGADGCWLAGPDTLTVSDSVLRGHDARPDPPTPEDGCSTYGFQATDTTVRRVVLTGYSFVLFGGELLAGSGTIRLEDVALIGHDGPVVSIGRRVEVERMAVAESRSLGAYVVAPEIDIRSLDVVGMRGGVVYSGAGVTLDNIEGVSTEAVLDRVSVRDGVGVGLLAAGSLTHASVTRLLVSGLEAPDCAGLEDCSPVAVGLLGTEGARPSVRDFVLGGSATCGVMIPDGQEVDLTRGVVSDNSIGACIQDPSFDLGRIMDEVYYLDNGTNLDSTALPEPTVPSF